MPVFCPTFSFDAEYHQDLEVGGDFGLEIDRAALTVKVVCIRDIVFEAGLGPVRIIEIETGGRGVLVLACAIEANVYFHGRDTIVLLLENATSDHIMRYPGDVIAEFALSPARTRGG